MANSTSIEVPLKGLGAQTVAAAVVLCTVSIIIVIMRTWVRISNGAIGIDDFLMIAAMLAFIGCCAFSNLGCLSGLGARDQAIWEVDPTGRINREGLKWFFAFQISWLLCLPFVKTSVCVALLRISRAKLHVIPLWTIIGITLLTTAYGLAGMLTQCRPVAASWNPSLGTCTTSGWVGSMAFSVAIISVLTDWACAIIPGFILWNLKMRLKVKISLAFVLSLGILASISTCIRLPHIHTSSTIHAKHDDSLYNAAYIVVWSVVECGIGIIAGSLPQLQPLFRRFGFGINSTGRKLTSGPDHDHNVPEGPAISGFHRQSRLSRPAPTATASPASPQSIELGRMGTMSRGSNSLTTTCQAGRPSQKWWNQSQTRTGEDDDDDVSTQKLIIVKNTQIDIEYDAAGPGKQI
ncbi:hypothetical protein GGR54DRAFT_120017 [Hypoxylon sp. NC1633]|nr:hypothetical protein GGR54DRAFT_120017 [Hypoxylon sp. NC1633]